MDSPCRPWRRLMASISAQLTLLQEPTLLPKVRIQFADFPYLHLILFGQRLITLETWCGFWYGFYLGRTPRGSALVWIFTRNSEEAPQNQVQLCHYGLIWLLLWLNQFHSQNKDGDHALCSRSREKRTLPCPHHYFSTPNSASQPFRAKGRSAVILNCFPFTI